MRSNHLICRADRPFRRRALDVRREFLLACRVAVDNAGFSASPSRAGEQRNYGGITGSVLVGSVGLVLRARYRTLSSASLFFGAFTSCNIRTRIAPLRSHLVNSSRSLVREPAGFFLVFARGKRLSSWTSRSIGALHEGDHCRGAGHDGLHHDRGGPRRYGLGRPRNPAAPPKWQADSAADRV